MSRHTGKRGGMHIGRTSRRTGALAMSLRLVLLALIPFSLLVGIIQKPPAYAADSFTGTCNISNGLRNHPNPHKGGEPMFSCLVHFPDTDITLRGYCYEHELDPSAGIRYPAPSSGTYTYTATSNGDGSYDVIVNTANSSGYFPGTWPYTNGKPVAPFGDPSIARQRIHVHNYTPNVTVKFTKVSSNTKLTSGNSEYSLKDATYKISRADTGTVAGTITTNASGEASLSLSPNTSYYATESNAPEGYKLASGRVSFSSGNGSTVKLSDTPGTVTVQVAKRDAATGGAAQPGLSLAGATYLLVDANGASHTAKTNAAGQLSFTGLPLGKVIITEVEPSPGYKLDLEKHVYQSRAEDLPESGVITIDARDDFIEVPIAFDIQIAKLLGDETPWEESSSTQNPAAGVRFDLISNTSGEVVGSITTADDGFATTAGESRWFGTGTRPEGAGGSIPFDPKGYTVHEAPETVPTGFAHVDDWTISADEIVDGETLRFIVDNKRLSTRLKINKIDAASGLPIPLAGFSFQIVDNTGKTVAMKDHYPSTDTIDTFTTDASGSVTLPERLATGTYRIKEVAAAAPYLVSTKAIAFTVEDNRADAVALAAVSYPNDQAMGIARLVKRCSCTQNGPKYSYGGSCELGRAEFDVVALEDIVSPDGTLRAQKGQIVDHVTTDVNGVAETRELYLGDGDARYAFVETAAPQGHVLDRTPHEFTLSWQGDDIPVVEKDVTIENHPNELVIDKMVLGTDEPLPGTTFALWNAQDEVHADPGAGSALVVAADDDSKIFVRPIAKTALVRAELPDGYSASIISVEGTTPVTETVTAPAGTYEIRITDNNGESVEHDLHSEEFVAGERYVIRVTRSIFTGTKVVLERGGSVFDPVKLKLDTASEAYIAENLPSGTAEIIRDGNPLSTVEVTQGETTYLSIKNGTLTQVPMVLKRRQALPEFVTDDSGQIVLQHIDTGSYRIAELSPAPGFVARDDVHLFTVDESGLVEGYDSLTIPIRNDYTKVDFSKRDITNEAELPGAHLEILDSEGNIIKSWTSTDEDHRINALPPGTYTLVERLTPRSYDEATAVEFTVDMTGEIQRVVMYDEPIEITGRVDKRQQIADPVVENVQADAVQQDGGSNRAPATVSDDGSYAYTIDAQNTSTTWVDEFTVTDRLSAAESGLAALDAIITPQAQGDYDGLVNLWFTTSMTAEDFLDPKGANATLSDGHVNPWLAHETTRETLGDDARRIDYAGWKLWRADIPADTATRFEVSDLELEDGEVVVGVRLEYGRVEKDFTTRLASWTRSDLKHEHDDIEQIQTEEAQDEGMIDLAPLILEMHVTDAYTTDRPLENSARVDLYRNGGNLHDEDALEDHNQDRVVQEPAPIPVEPPIPVLPKTGTLSPTLLLVISGLLMFFALIIHRIVRAQRAHAARREAHIGIPHHARRKQ